MKAIMRCCQVLFVLLIGLIVSTPAHCTPSVHNLQLSTESVGLYDVIELSAEIDTTATNPYWPYDESPPAGINAKAGVTVDGLFSNDDWATTIVVPGFYYQDCERQLVTGDGSNFLDESITPVGSPLWLIRFAPTITGTWKCKIRVTDSGGTTISSESSFVCVSSTNHGLVQVSEMDPRYFCLSDGTVLSGPGMNLPDIKTTYLADSLLQTCGDNDVKIVRVMFTNIQWQTPFGLSSWNAIWNFCLSLSNTGGFKPSDRYCASVAAGANTFQRVYLGSGALYRLTGHIRTSGITGTGAYFYINNVKSTNLTGDNDWQTITLDYTPASSAQISIGCRNEGSAGIAYFDDISLKKSTDGGVTWSGDYLSKGDFDAQNYVDQINAWKIDHIYSAAKNDGVYIKAVMLEKADYTLGCINPDGTTGSYSVSNVYASTTHPSRWLQKAWWRYMVARWSCYASMHSWEFCNEGDPFDASHYDAANAMADFVHSISPNKSLCATSFWHSIPMEFWKSSSCDYLDCHEYIGPRVFSHGPRVYGALDGISALPSSSSAGTIEFDAAEHHNGVQSLKLTPQPSTGPGVFQYLPGGAYHVGINPSHSYTVRFWAKADNVSNPINTVHPGIYLVWSKAYHENDFVAQTWISADYGTYSWTCFTQKGIVPASAANTATIYPMCTRQASGSSHFWIDDIEFIDETTGENLFFDGGFESERIDNDTAAATLKFGRLLRSYAGRISKPCVWGETGIDGTNELGSPYKGYTFDDENQHLVDDLDVIHLKKMIWAHCGAQCPTMLYYWNDNISRKNKWNYFRAFQSFISGIPLANSHYVDASASVSNTSIRAIGQKDLTNNCAHIWVDNIPYNWKNVVDGVSVAQATGDVTISGFKNGEYVIEKWNTSTGAIDSTGAYTCSDGNITIHVDSLVSDAAYKIYLKPAKIDLRVIVPSAQVIPGQAVTITVEYTNSGSTDAHNVTISARVPAEMDYVSGSAEKSGGTLNAQTGYVSWVIDYLPAQQTGTRTFSAVVH
ncbi:MAG: hypothetical protein ABFD83_01660 [Armatimonadota bacterium]